MPEKDDKPPLQAVDKFGKSRPTMRSLWEQVETIRLILDNKTFTQMSEPAREALSSHQNELKERLAQIESALHRGIVYKPYVQELVNKLTYQIYELNQDILLFLATQALISQQLKGMAFTSPIEVAFARSLAEAAEPSEEESGIRTPISIYLKDGSANKAVESATENLLAVLGATRTEAEDPLSGSWFRRFTAWFHTSPEAQHLAIEVQRAIELRAIHEAQAKVDGALADAVGKLLDALKDEPNGVIQVGSILVIKSEGVPMVRQLSQGELAYLERNPRLMTQPDQLMKVLRDGVPTAAHTSSVSQPMLET